jgi:hypothetical protein
MRAFLTKLMNDKLMRHRRSAMGRQRAYCERLAGVLRDWDALFTELRDDAAGGTTRVRENYVRSVDDFLRRRTEAVEQLRALETAPAADWAAGRPEVERTFDDLRRFVAGTERI